MDWLIYFNYMFNCLGQRLKNYVRLYLHFCLISYAFCTLEILHSHNQLYTYTRRNIVSIIKTNETQFFRKIYLSLYLKGWRKGYVWEVSWRLNKTATYWPPALPAIAALLSHPAGLLNRGPECPALCWVWFSLLRTATTDSKLQTIWTSCRTGLYHCLTFTCFMWASHLNRIQLVHGRGYTLISSTGCTCSLINSWVNMLQKECQVPQSNRNNLQKDVFYLRMGP